MTERRVDTSAPPYYSRFDSEKNRTQLLFQSDRAIQQSELNELQEIQRHHTRMLGDALFNDGAIQNGMDFVLNTSTGVLTIEEGKIYVDGLVRDFPKQTIRLTRSGEELVGVKIEQRVITSTEDPSLRDQTQEARSYLEDGADRLEERVVLTLNDQSAVNILRFIDGRLFVNPPKPDIAKINEVLAERTYDESGSYRVSGFDMWIEPNQNDANRVDLMVDSGRAYILGYKVDKPTATRIPLPKSQTTRDVTAEPFTYTTAGAATQGWLGNNPVQRVSRVTAQVRVASETRSRGNTANGSDSLTNMSVVSITRVWQGETEFKAGDDYLLTDNRFVDWSPAGREPANGTSYNVEYVYNRVMTESADYDVVTSGTGDGRRTRIKFDGKTGQKPVNNTAVLVDYSFYLARRDLIILDKEGNFTVRQGSPDREVLVEAPNHVDPLTLRIGIVTLKPNSNNGTPLSFSVTRLTMEDLQKIKRRVEDLEYNQALNALDQAAMAPENPLVLRGVFSDGFISLEKFDDGHADSNIAFSFEDAEITLPFSAINKDRPSLLNTSNATKWGTTGRIVTAPYVRERRIFQPFATETMNVNPYMVFERMGVLGLTPASDNWISEERVTVTEDEVATVRVNRWWAHGGEMYDETTRYIANNLKLDEGQTWEGHSWRHDVDHGRTGTLLESGGQRTKETMITYMRRIELTLKAENLEPNANNLSVSFDGERVPVRPHGVSTAGQAAGTIMANNQGVAEGKFTIPEGIRTGTREVTITNAGSVTGTTSTGTTTFTAQGVHRRVEDVIIRTRVTVQLYDPLAQSFAFEEDQTLQSVGLYFASKGTQNLLVQIRGLSEGGQPNRTVYGERTLRPEQINVSANASAETVVSFDDPIMCRAGQSYCVVMITDSADYTMWIATMGQNRIDDASQMINNNPYVNGVLFSSSNAVTWTAHQRSDLKFAIYTARFQQQGVLEFDTIRNITVDRLVLMSSYLTPQNTGCKWDMKLILSTEPQNTNINNKPWLPIANYQDLDISQVAREVKLRATFESNRYISPMLSLEDILLVTFVTRLRGSYISRTMDLADAPFNTVRCTFEAFRPGESTVIPRYSVDGGTTWRNIEATGENFQTIDMGNGFVQYRYNQRIATGSQTFNNFKIRLDLESKNAFQRPRVKRLMCTMKNE